MPGTPVFELRMRLLQLQKDLEDLNKVHADMRSPDFPARVKAIEAEINFLRAELRRFEGAP